MVENKRYCLDTNIYIEGWNKYFSTELSTGYWEILDSFALNGQVFSPIEVKREILRLDDGLSDWLKTRPYFFREITNKVQKEMRSIMASYPRLVDNTKQRSIADPWVIAFAITENAIVVTKETPVGSNSRRIKIPDVCNDLNIPWIDDFRFALELGIHFTAHLKT